MAATELTCVNPATGEVIERLTCTPPDGVRAATQRARVAQKAWAALSVRVRAERMLAYRSTLVANTDALIETILKESSKPRYEALAHEILASAQVVSYLAKHAEETLAPEEAALQLLPHRRGLVHFVPRGVIGVISPWNFPLLMPMREVLAALLAGNGVVLKPAEQGSLIARHAKKLWDSTPDLDPELFQVVIGGGDVGRALVESGVDMISFTGGVATGRRVAAACGERLIPCVMELGGKAPLIACADAPIDATARAIVFGGFANMGQACVCVERVYAHTRIAEALTARVVELTKELRQGNPAQEEVELGPIIFRPQIDIAEKHIKDALEKGARIRTGGHRIDRPGTWFEPTVLDTCSHQMTVMTEEIFGPIIPIMTVGTEEEAIALSNEVPLGLNAYVYTADTARGYEIAQRIEAGSVLVNEVILNGGCPELPFGGIKNSGFGRVLGRHALRDYCYPKAIMLDRMPSPIDPFQYPYSSKRYALLHKGFLAAFSGRSPLRKLLDRF